MDATMTKQSIKFLSIGAMLMLSAAAGAQTQRSGNDATRVMQQLKQVSAEKTR